MFACYDRGLVGRWHLGSQMQRDNAPWQRGFDEYIGFRGGKQPYFKAGALQCSPPSARYCLVGPRKDRRCINDAECGGPGRCALTARAEHGLYVGAQASNPCHQDAAETSAKHADCCEAGGDAPGIYDYGDKRFPTIDSPRSRGAGQQFALPCSGRRA
jgi:hypothetical protein